MAAPGTGLKADQAGLGQEDSEDLIHPELHLIEVEPFE